MNKGIHQKHITKKCPFFEEATFRYCKAMEKRVMIPVRTEDEKFCSCNNYLKCILYKDKGKHKVKVKRR